MVKKVGKALVLGLGHLLGAAIGAWLSLAALYWLLEPGQRASSAPLIVAVAALFAGLVPLAVAFILAAAAGAWMLS